MLVRRNITKLQSLVLQGSGKGQLIIWRNVFIANYLYFKFHKLSKMEIALYAFYIMIWVHIPIKSPCQTYLTPLDYGVA